RVHGMTRNDGVDVLQRAGGFSQAVADLDSTSAIVRIEKRQILAGKNIAGMHDAKHGKENPCIAVGMTAAEIKKINAIVPGANRHFVLERAFRHADTVVLFENVRRWTLLWNSVAPRISIML